MNETLFENDYIIVKFINNSIKIISKDIIYNTGLHPILVDFKIPKED
jgi:hypothetical protein